MRGKFRETGTLTLSVNFTFCRREGLSLNMKRRLDGLHFDRVDTRKMLKLRLELSSHPDCGVSAHV